MELAIRLNAARARFPGLLASVTVAVAAVFLNEHYGAPAMLFALLLGLAFKFLSEEGPCVPGILVASTTVLRIGVALLGFRITIDQLMSLGPNVIVMIILSVSSTIGLGLLLARVFGVDWRLGLLTGSAVGICGAAAALTIAALLPRIEENSRWTLFTVVGVTALSTMAMIGYPILAAALGLSHHDTGLFLGATIHDVAQVMGAGYAVSDDTGDIAALVKMMRVTMLVPVVLICGMLIPQGNDRETRYRNPLPWFVAAFAAFVAVNSLGYVSPKVGEGLSALSRWCLIIGIAAMGMRTSFKDVLGIGARAIALLCVETIVLAALTLALIVGILR
jgi:uncharacterized integral membrane protein (TIGR00698 family)